jgi:hypothetical protein
VHQRGGENHLYIVCIYLLASTKDGFSAFQLITPFPGSPFEDAPHSVSPRRFSELLSRSTLKSLKIMGATHLWEVCHVFGTWGYFTDSNLDCAASLSSAIPFTADDQQGV